MMTRFRQTIRNEIEAPLADRRFGSGWISGIVGLTGSIMAFLIMLCILFPDRLTMPELRAHYDGIPFRLLLDGLLLLSFGFALGNLVLRRVKILGYTAIAIILLTTLAGQFGIQAPLQSGSGIFFGLDWFVLNVLFTGAIFIPFERLFAQWPDQRLFRPEWREDLFYYFVSSLMVQVLTYLTLLPSQTILSHTHFDALKSLLSSQPFLLQLIEIMVLTDIVQYWMHRMFHRIPALWKFHSVHHSARSLDWLAGARMHFVEIFCLRGVTAIPMMVLGFSPVAVQAYILLVYIYATFVHANISFSPRWLSNILVLPRYHHWHHAIEKEAIDVNFAVHFPFIDRLFGTHHLPEGRWPGGYGIPMAVPPGYLRQFTYPFRSKKS